MNAGSPPLFISRKSGQFFLSDEKRELSYLNAFKAAALKRVSPLNSDNSKSAQGPGAESEEKREPVSDIDTEVVDSLKLLDPRRPIREADIMRCSIEPIHAVSFTFVFLRLDRAPWQRPCRRRRRLRRPFCAWQDRDRTTLWRPWDQA